MFHKSLIFLPKELLLIIFDLLSPPKGQVKLMIEFLVTLSETSQYWKDIINDKSFIRKHVFEPTTVIEFQNIDYTQKEYDRWGERPLVDQPGYDWAFGDIESELPYTIINPYHYTAVRAVIANLDQFESNVQCEEMSRKDMCYETYDKYTPEQFEEKKHIIGGGINAKSEIRINIDETEEKIFQIVLERENQDKLYFPGKHPLLSNAVPNLEIPKPPTQEEMEEQYNFYVHNRDDIWGNLKPSPTYYYQ